MPADIRNDPFRGFSFRLEIDGTAIAAFSEVSGLPAKGALVDAASTTCSLADRRKVASLTLMRGYAKDTLWRCYQRITAQRGSAAGPDLSCLRRRADASFEPQQNAAGSRLVGEN